MNSFILLTFIEALTEEEKEKIAKIKKKMKRKVSFCGSFDRFMLTYLILLLFLSRHA